MKTLLSILLFLGLTGAASAQNYYHDDPSAALLHFSLLGLNGYGDIEDTYERAGTNILFHQFANDEDYRTAYKSEFEHSPNAQNMLDYRSVLSYISTYQDAQRSLVGMGHSRTDLFDFTNPDKYGFPRRSTFGSASSASLSTSAEMTPSSSTLPLEFYLYADHP